MVAVKEKSKPKNGRSAKPVVEPEEDAIVQPEVGPLNSVDPGDEVTAPGEAAPAEAAEAKPLSQLEREFLESIQTAEEACDEAETEMVKASMLAREAKKTWEGLVAKLRNMIRRGPDPQQKLPGLDDEVSSTEYLEELLEVVLDLTKKQFEALDEAGIYTVGDFEDCRAKKIPHLPDGLRSIKGVGEATAERWENDVLAWIAKQTPVTVAETAEDGEDE